MNHARQMKLRINNLMELERIIENIKGEIICHHAVLKEAFLCAGGRASEPFRTWLVRLAASLDSKEGGYMEDVSHGIYGLWRQAVRELVNFDLIDEEDAQLLYPIGKALGYLDIELQIRSVDLELSHIRKHVDKLMTDLPGKTRLSVMLGALIAILLVVVLI